MNADSSYRYGVRIGRFLQDIATHYTIIDDDVGQKVCRLLYTADGHVFAGTPAGLRRLDAATREWRPIGAPELDTAPAQWLFETTGGLVMLTDSQAYQLDPHAHIRHLGALPEGLLDVAASAKGI